MYVLKNQAMTKVPIKASAAALPAPLLLGPKLGEPGAPCRAPGGGAPIGGPDGGPDGDPDESPAVGPAGAESVGGELFGGAPLSPAGQAPLI